MTITKMSREPLKPLPYGGDRKPGDPTLEEIEEGRKRFAGVPVGSSYRGPRRAKMHASLRGIKDYGDG